MSMTAVQVIESARLSTGDTDQSRQTWNDATFLIALNDGLSLIYTNYPETRTDSSGGLYEFARIEQQGLMSDMSLSDQYFSALVEYLAFRFFDSDQGDTRDAATATVHWTAFRRIMNPNQVSDQKVR